MFGHDTIEKRKVYKNIETFQKQLGEVKHDICKKENEMKLLPLKIEYNNLILSNKGMKTKC